MTLYNPFMPWLNPRSSGLIAFGGGGGGGASAEEVETIVDDAVAPINEAGAVLGTASQSGTTTGNTGSFTTPVVTNTAADGTVTTTGGETVNYGGQEVGVTDTIKGDTEQIIGGQSTTQDLINQRFDSFGGGGSTTNIVNEIDTSDLAKVGQVDQGFATSAANQAEIMSDTGQILSDVGKVRADTQGLGNRVDTGFANVGNQLTGVGEQVEGVSGALNDLSGNVTTGFDDVNQNVATGFANTTDALNTGFTNQADKLDAASANIMGGQANLQNFLDDLSGRQDIYYGGLAEGQSNILNDVGGLQTAFTGFRNQYDDDTALANRSRADLQEMVTGGIGTLREEMADANDAASRARTNIQAAVNTGNQAAQQGAGAQAAATVNFGKALADITAGAQPQSMGELTVARDVVNRLGVIRQVLASPNNMDANMRDQYTKLANAFDETGALIPSSVDAQGNTTNRAIDQRSNLLLATANNQGQLIDQSALNMNQLFGAMDQLGYSGTGNATGGLSPQNLANRNVAVNTGFAAQNEPFFRTTG